MNIPPGQTQESVLAAIEITVSRLAKSFVFGYYDLDDIRQEARVFALELIAKGTYDPSRPLENYIFTHMQNRLINFRRDKLRRNESPCKSCHDGFPCSDAAAPSFCVRYTAWLKRNQAKSNLLRPLDLNNINDERERKTRTLDTASDDAEIREIVELIDKHLPLEMRGDYLQMRAGCTVPKSRRLEIEETVKDIIACKKNLDD